MKTNWTPNKEQIEWHRQHLKSFEDRFKRINESVGVWAIATIGVYKVNVQDKTVQAMTPITDNQYHNRMTQTLKVLNYRMIA